MEKNLLLTQSFGNKENLFWYVSCSTLPELEKLNFNNGSIKKDFPENTMTYLKRY